MQRFDAATWARHAYAYVVEGNLAKFGQHPSLQAFLAATGEMVLVEAGPDDRVWGIGLAADLQDACVPARWPGEKLLGFALMEVRNRLRCG